MLSGDFQRKLQKLNKNLRIFSTDNKSRTANIYHVVRGEYQPICGVDKNYLGERTVKGERGVILHGGWRRALKILIGQGFIDRREAEKEFRATLPYKQEKKISVYDNPYKK